MSDLTRQVFSLVLLMPGLPPYRAAVLARASSHAVTSAVASLTRRGLLTLDSRGGLRVAPWTLL